MAVVDSSALIPLIKIGRLDLLRKVFDEILIPEAVWEEVVVEGKKLGKAVKEFEEGKERWFKVVAGRKPDSTPMSLEANDYQVFSTAKDDILLTNDASLYYFALSQNGRPYWLTTLVLAAVKKKKISRNEAQDILLELVNTGGMHLKSDILSELLMIIRNM